MTDPAMRSAFEWLEQQVLGCDWGFSITSPDDTECCPERAVQVVVLHDGDKTYERKLCARHLAVVKEHTDPHREDT